MASRRSQRAAAIGARRFGGGGRGGGGRARGFQSLICWKYFGSHISLLQHRSAKHRRRFYRCLRCRKKFNTADGRKLHHRRCLFH